MARLRFRQEFLLGGILLWSFGIGQCTVVEQQAPIAALQKEVTQQPISRADLFKAYGWTKPDQQKALCQLLKFASVQVDTTHLEKEWPQEEILNWLLELIRETQAKFWNRAGGKERWQVGPLSWMVNNTNASWDCLKTLGFVSAVEPKNGSRGTVCLLGAAKGRMQARLQFLKELINRGKLQVEKLVLLSGERLVTEKVDGSREELEKIAHFSHKDSWEKVTEMDILRYLVDQDPELKKLPIVVVDTKAQQKSDGTWARPTTQSTVAKWLEESPADGPVYFISSQPHVQPQTAGILSVFKAKKMPDGEIQTIGAEFAAETPTAQMVKQGAEALGGALRAMAPMVLARLGIALPNKIKEDFVELYKNDPYLLAIVERL